jgi:hypothetical protein
MAALFSDNFDSFLHSLQPHTGPQGNLTYPAGLVWQDAQIRGNETPRDMLMRCATNAAGGDVQRCLIEDDLAVCAFVKWRDNDTLSSASIQAVKTIGIDVRTYLAGPGDHQAQYFRLDVERRTGLIFTHPFPHAHYVPHGEVRYSLNGWESRNVVIDFFEHIYLQCYHPLWLAWAENLWNRHWSLAARAGFPNPFHTIVDAFRESQYQVLEQHQQDVEALKSVLRRKKDDVYRLRVDGARCSLLAYPAA